MRTRAQEQKEERRGRHVCVCPLGEKCVSEHTFRLPKDEEECAAWLGALGVASPASVPKDGRVSATHWPEKVLKFTGSLRLKRAVSTALPRRDPLPHDEERLETTARRTYVTMLKACETIMTHHQARPSLEAVRQAVPISMCAGLALSEHAALYISDATERETLSPRNPTLHGILYSQYKSRTTLKYNGVCLPNGFLFEFSKGYGGSTSDNTIMGVDGVGKRLAINHSHPLVIRQRPHPAPPP